MRVLHVLHHSAPYLDGYGVRSKYIIDFQRRLGLDPIVVTSAHHEFEVNREAPDCPAAETIDGVVYYRTPSPTGLTASFRLRTPFLRERALMAAIRVSIDRLLTRERVDIVHSHSPVLCGRPALDAARHRGIPMVYEIRGFWEDAFLIGPRRFGLSGAKYRYAWGLETQLIRDCNKVITISRHMLDDIVGRGIDRGKLHVMPNGVDVNVFAPVSRDRELAQRLGLQPDKTVGFIGSFYDLEGIDCLVKAMPLVLQSEPQAKLVLVGSGNESGNIARLVDRLGLGAQVQLVGRVNHNEVPRYYSVMDLLVYPRHRYRVCELVTPLKPLEAMALGKAVIASNVGGLTELLDDGRVGAIFEADNAASLAGEILRLLKDTNARERLAAAGRAYALQQRSWEHLVPGYLPIYEELLTRGHGRAG